MTVTLEQVKQVCAELIAANPGKRNAVMQNYEDGAPCCIAGHVYDVLNTLPECEEGSVRALWEAGSFQQEWDEDAVLWLGDVQDEADRQYDDDGFACADTPTWAEAVAAVTA